MRNSALFIAVGSIYLVLSSASPTSEIKTKLEFVQILFRHGDRAPDELYPTDPNPASTWKYGLGELTKLGKQQMLSLGKFLRARYDKFSDFTPMEVQVNSSAQDRTLMSAMTTMASFFRPRQADLIDPYLNWQPLPIHHIPRMYDKYLSADSYCPKAFQLLNSTEYEEFLKEHKRMFKYYEHHSGFSMKEWENLMHLGDSLIVEIKQGHKVPLWVDLFLNTFATSMIEFTLNLFRSPVLLRLRGGPLIGEIANNLKEKRDGKIPERKFQVYSAHDVHITTILEMLNLFNDRYPPYASSLIFEMHEMPSGQHTVKLFYQNSTKPEKGIKQVHLLKMPGCGEYCPVDHFINMVEPWVPENWAEECGIQKSDFHLTKQKETASNDVPIAEETAVVPPQQPSANATLEQAAPAASPQQPNSLTTQGPPNLSTAKEESSTKAPEEKSLKKKRKSGAFMSNFL